MAVSRLRIPVKDSESSYNPSDWLKNKSSHVTGDKVMRYGNVICISFTLTSGTAIEETLFGFDESIMPKTSSLFYVFPLFEGSGSIYPNGSVWLWRGENVAKFYAPAALSTNVYCSMIYIV